MQGLKKFYKYYGAIIGLLSLWFLFRDLGFIIPFSFLLTLPILIYGTFVYFPSRFYARFARHNTQSQQDKQESEDTSTFRILYVVALVGFILIILIK